MVQAEMQAQDALTMQMNKAAQMLNEHAHAHGLHVSIEKDGSGVFRMYVQVWDSKNNTAVEDPEKLKQLAPKLKDSMSELAKEAKESKDDSKKALFIQMVATTKESGFSDADVKKLGTMLDGTSDRAVDELAKKIQNAKVGLKSEEAKEGGGQGAARTYAYLITDKEFWDTVKAVKAADFDRLLHERLQQVPVKMREGIEEKGTGHVEVGEGKVRVGVGTAESRSAVMEGEYKAALHKGFEEGAIRAMQQGREEAMKAVFKEIEGNPEKYKGHGLSIEDGKMYVSYVFKGEKKKVLVMDDKGKINQEGYKDLTHICNTLENKQYKESKEWKDDPVKALIAEKVSEKLQSSGVDVKGLLKEAEDKYAELYGERKRGVFSRTGYLCGLAYEAGEISKK
ncbi:MAG: hypothetical protein N3G76_02770 [Candidatus Micrarchaeota archaeon]|nr:hypothetical protein [Candidatus Micrarchaeota archaeon]